MNLLGEPEEPGYFADNVEIFVMFGLQPIYL